MRRNGNGVSVTSVGDESVHAASRQTAQNRSHWSRSLRCNAEMRQAVASEFAPTHPAHVRPLMDQTLARRLDGSRSDSPALLQVLRIVHAADMVAKRASGGPRWRRVGRERRTSRARSRTGWHSSNSAAFQGPTSPEVPTRDRGGERRGDQLSVFAPANSPSASRNSMFAINQSCHQPGSIPGTWPSSNDLA